MLHSACAQAAAWTTLTGRTDVSVAVNIPVQLLLDASLVDMAEAARAAHALPGDQLVPKESNDPANSRQYDPPAATSCKAPCSLDPAQATRLTT